MINDPVHVLLHTHLAYELLDSLVEGIVAEVKLRGHPLGLVGECHAALVLSIEGTDKLDLLLRFGTDGRFLQDDWVSEGEASCVISGNEAHKGVGKVGYEESSPKR